MFIWFMIVFIGLGGTHIPVEHRADDNVVGPTRLDTRGTGHQTHNSGTPTRR